MDTPLTLESHHVGGITSGKRRWRGIKKTCNKICDQHQMKMINDSLMKENIAKEKEIRKLHKDVQQYEKTISNLRMEMSHTNVYCNNVEACTTSDVGLMAGPCLTGTECGDWEPVRDFTKMLQDETEQFQERIQKLEASLKSSNENIRTLRKVNVSLTEEMHAMQRVCVALVEENRSATVRAQFKDDIIREMRRQLKQAKAKVHRLPICVFSSKATSSPNTSKAAAVDSTLDVSIIEPSDSPPITASDVSNEPPQTFNPFKYILSKARQWSESGNSKTSLKEQTQENTTDFDSEKPKGCFRNKSDSKLSKSVKIEPLTTKDDYYGPPQYTKFCDDVIKMGASTESFKCKNQNCPEQSKDSKLIKILKAVKRGVFNTRDDDNNEIDNKIEESDDKPCPYNGVCEDLSKTSASAVSLNCKNQDCIVNVKGSKLKISNKISEKSLKINDVDDERSPCNNFCDNIERIGATTQRFQCENQYCPLHAEPKNVSTCSTQTMRNTLANTSSGFQESAGTDSLLDSPPGVCDVNARIEHLSNKLRSALLIIQYKEETIKEQEGSLSVAEKRIASLTERASEMRHELDLKSKEVSSLRKKLERNSDRNEMAHTCYSTASDLENQSDVVKTLQKNLNIIEELYRECFYETAKQEDLIDMLRNSYLDVRLQDKQKTEQIGRMQTVIDKQSWSLDKCQDIALEVDNLKSEICNFLSSSTSINNDSGMWERSEESFASVPGVQEDLQEITEQLLTLRELLTLQPRSTLKESNVKLKEDNETLEKKLKEICASPCEVQRMIRLKDNAVKVYLEQIELKDKQLVEAAYQIEKLNNEKCMNKAQCESLTSQLQQMHETLARTENELTQTKHICDLRQKAITEFRKRIDVEEDVCHKFQEENNHLKEQNVKLDLKVRELRDSESKLKQMLDAKEKAEKQYQKEIEPIKESLQKSNGQIKLLNETLDLKLEELRETQCELQNVFQLKGKIETMYRKDIEQKERELQEAHRKINTQKETLDLNMRELCRVECELQKLLDLKENADKLCMKEIKTKEMLRQELLDATVRMKSQQEMLDIKNQELCVCQAKLQTALELKERVEKQSEKEVEKKQRELADTLCTCEKIKQQYCEKNAECESLAIQLQQTLVSLEEMRNTCNSQQITIADIKQKLNNAETAYQELQEANDRSNLKNVNKEQNSQEQCELRKVLELKEKAEKLYKNELKLKDDQLLEANKKLKSLSKKLDKKHQELCECQGEIQKELELKDKAEEKHTKEAELTDERLKNMELTLARYETELNEKNAQCKLLTSQLEQRKVTMDEKCEELMLMKNTCDLQQKTIGGLIKELNVSENMCKELQKGNDSIKTGKEKFDRRFREVSVNNSGRQKSVEKQYSKQMELKNEQLVEAERKLKKCTQEISEKNARCESLKQQLLDLQTLLVEKDCELQQTKKCYNSQQRNIADIKQQCNNGENMCQESCNIRKEVLNLTSQVEQWRAQLEESEARVRKMDAKFFHLESCYKEKESEVSELQSQLQAAHARGSELCGDAHRMLGAVRHWAGRMRQRLRAQEQKVKEREDYVEFLQKRLSEQCKCGHGTDTTEDELSSSNSNLEPRFSTKSFASFHCDVPSHSSISLRCKRKLKRTCSEKGRTLLRSPRLASFDRTGDQTPQLNKCPSLCCNTEPCSSRTATSTRMISPMDQLHERMDQLTKAFHDGCKRWKLNSQNR